MALLGSSIDPRLQLQDYSGVVNAATMQAQGLANIGSQIEQAAEQYKQYKKEQADTQKRVKAAATVADSIATLVPELKGPLGAAVIQLKDPNLTLADKDALAQSISSTLQLGIGVVSGNKELALKERQIAASEAATRATLSQENQKRMTADRIAAATTLGIMQNLPQESQGFIKSNFLDQGLYKEGEAYAKQISDALSKGADVREITWIQNGVTMRGLGQRTSPNQPYKPISVDLGVPQDVPEPQAGGVQQALNMQLPEATPPGQGLGEPVLLPALGEVGGTKAPPPENIVVAAAPVQQSGMSFTTIEQDGKKVLARGNPNTKEIEVLKDKEGKPYLVSDEKNTKEKYFREAMQAWDAGDVDEAVIKANAANAGSLFGGIVAASDLEMKFGRVAGTKAKVFPMKIIKNGTPATVYNEAQLREAQDEGFAPIGE